jgi:hypothetical protein
VDLSQCGSGKLNAKILNEKQQECRFDIIQTNLPNVYEIAFNPPDPGHFRCILMVNEKQIKGKSFIIIKKFFFFKREGRDKIRNQYFL